MTSNKGMGPKKQFWPIRMKLSKPFRRQLTHYAEKFLHELLTNISLIKCPTPIGSTKIRAKNRVALSVWLSILMFYHNFKNILFLLFSIVFILSYSNVL